MMAPDSVSPNDRRPIRAETRATLVASIARGRCWLDEIVAGTVTSVEQIAARDKCSIRQVNMTISLAFLAPDLVEGCRRRTTASRGRRRSPARCSRRVVPPIRDARFVDVNLVGLHVQLSPAPGTALQSPETGSQNRRYRDLGRCQRPHVPHLLLLIAAPLSFAAFSANHQSCDTQRHFLPLLL